MGHQGPLTSIRKRSEINRCRTLLCGLKRVFANTSRRKRIGHFAESAALEWAGVTIASLFVFVRMLAIFKGAMDKRMTPEQARKWLDERFPEADQ